MTEGAFQALKKLFVQKPALKAPDYESTLVVQCGPIERVIGAVSSQVDEPKTSDPFATLPESLLFARRLTALERSSALACSGP